MYQAKTKLEELLRLNGLKRPRLSYYYPNRLEAKKIQAPIDL